MRKIFIAIVMMTGMIQAHAQDQNFWIFRHYALRYLEVTNPGLAEKCRALINK
jgi:hypothetical protein